MKDGDETTERKGDEGDHQHEGFEAEEEAKE